MNKIKLLILLSLTVLITGCNKIDEELVSEKMAELENVQAMRVKPSKVELEEHCNSMGGIYETWGDGSVFCMMGNYGCDPEELYRGSCGVGI